MERAGTDDNATPPFEEVAVVGNGPWGTVLADLMAANHQRVLLWGEDDDAQEAITGRQTHPRLPGVTLSERIVAAGDLSRVASAGAIVIALAPERFRDIAVRLGDYLRGDHRVLCAGRGFEPGTSTRMSEIIRAESCVKLVGALAGPRLTLEMAQGAPGGGVIGSAFGGLAAEMQQRLSSSRYRVYTSRDPVGVELGPTLASVASFVAGVVDGAELGPGAQALVISRAQVEGAALGQALGAEAATFSGMCFLGVLIGSCLSKRGDDYRLGVAVGADRDLLLEHLKAFPEQHVLASAEAMARLAHEHGVPMPLQMAAVALLRGAMSPEHLRTQLMTRPLTDER